MKNICVNRNSKNFVWSFVTGILLRCGAMGVAIRRQRGLGRQMGKVPVPDIGKGRRAIDGFVARWMARMNYSGNRGKWIGLLKIYRIFTNCFHVKSSRWLNVLCGLDAVDR
ncbi:hypothetical protein [Burkholderia gladioli]|uniref:hypothetical protein n=1 Tax=Burkholderia gladioli TaxID=28095 RepID=UPI00163E7744|nr:hypothetical protein [Burkholderia gladioli]MDA0571661.1 hypothetical protein [Burkholderia gladioli]MDA0599648.1 hypothetical protein [Burkholderia gladioli]